MRSIFTKIVLWGIAALLLSMFGLYVTARVRGWLHPERIDMITKLQTIEIEGARRALEAGGPAELGVFLNRIDQLFDARHYFVDAHGRDIVDGRDRSALLRVASVRPRPPAMSEGKAFIASPPEPDGNRLLVEVKMPPLPPSFLTDLLWMIVVIVGLGAALAANLARPLRALERAVERFGHGDLSARIRSTRRDEIGSLARAFDEMADRIEILLTAERRLLQDVSHELRSPLARLGFAIELARTSDNRQAALDRISKDVGRLGDLVGQLLQLTRAEGDPESLDRQPLRLDTLVRDVVSDCTLESTAKSCVFHANIAGPASLVGDRELLRRAVENVVRNAIRHAPDGSAIDVILATPDHRVVLDVRDRGEGVPDEALAKIFEPFYRIGSDRNRASGGVGLGLTIARRAIHLHHGRMTASNVHPGLRVRIEWHLDSDSDSAPDSEAP